MSIEQLFGSRDENVIIKISSVQKTQLDMNSFKWAGDAAPNLGSTKSVT